MKGEKNCGQRATERETKEKEWREGSQKGTPRGSCSIESRDTLTKNKRGLKGGERDVIYPLSRGEGKSIE